MEGIESDRVMGAAFRIVLIVPGILLMAVGCGGRVSERHVGSPSVDRVPVEIVVPTQDTIIVSGSQLMVQWATEADSCQVFFGAERIGVENGAAIDTKNCPLGVQHIRVVAWRNGGSSEALRRVAILAADAPQEYGYRVMKEYPHDENAYTQGLLFHNGSLYESTGQRGASTARRVELATGEVQQQQKLIDSEFGEGLTLHGGVLYQLTWTSHRCHLYDLETLSPIGEFYYNTQGWGLESDGVYLYMTDGTENIYVLDSKTFKVLRTIQAYTNEGPQRMLNELEFIEGLLYANVYLTDEIVAINPETGAVVRRVRLDGLLPERYRTPHVEVLNGIAYDAERGAIYLTGKYWPKLYHVEFVAK